MRRRAGVIIIDDSKVLLLYRRSDHWGSLAEYYVVPGGGVEAGETDEQAAIRELKEEAGLNIELNQKILEFENKNQMEIFFTCKSYTGVIEMNAEERSKISENNYTELRWIDLNEISSLPLVPQQIKDWIIDIY